MFFAIYSFVNEMIPFLLIRDSMFFLLFIVPVAP